MPKPMYVAVKALLFKNSKLLLLKKKHEGFWDIPGGRIEFGESIDSAMMRELMEELPNASNLRIRELVGVRKKPEPLEDGTELFLVYYRVRADLPERIAVSDEHTEARWFSQQEIELLPTPFNTIYADLFAQLWWWQLHKLKKP